MNGNAVNDVPEDLNPKKQWEDIDHHLRQMRAWTDETNSPLSTSPAGRPGPAHVPVVSRVQRSPLNPHNPLYRRSEGDIQGGATESPKTINPPQSAPVIHEDFDWDTLPPAMHQRKASQGIPPHKDKHSSMFSDRNSAPNKHFFNKSRSADMFIRNADNVENSSNHTLYDNNRNIHLIEDDKHRNLPSSNFITGNAVNQFVVDSGRDPRTSAYETHGRDLNFSDNVSSGNVSPQVQPSSLLQMDHNIAHLPPLYGLQPQTSVNSPTSMIKSPSTRRKSAPVTDAYNHFTAGPRRALSQSVMPVQSSRIAPPFVFAVKTDIPDLVEVDEHDSSAESQSGGKYDDKEYTIALLQHQTDRMSRLKAQFEVKQNELSSLIIEVQNMETKVLQRNPNYKAPSPLPTLQLDVGRLRDINRKLEIDCNCMYKEVDLFSRDGDSTREDFYFRYNRNPTKPKKKEGNIRPHIPQSNLPPPPVPPPVPPPPETDDEPKWRCSHCTFDNHAALNKCEMCEFSRDVHSARTRVP